MTDEDRLTAHNEAGQGIINMNGVSDELEARERIRRFSPLIISKLTEYEDTGLSPDEVNELKAENAALRERLAHSLDLPYMEQTVSQYGTEDTVLYYMENGKLQQECFNNKFPEQLQARLAELKGE